MCGFCSLRQDANLHLTPVIQGSTRISRPRRTCQILPDSAAFCQILPRSARFCHVLPNPATFCRVLPNAVLCMKNGKPSGPRIALRHPYSLVNSPRRPYSTALQQHPPHNTPKTAFWRKKSSADIVSSWLAAPKLFKISRNYFTSTGRRGLTTRPSLFARPVAKNVRQSKDDK